MINNKEKAKNIVKLFYCKMKRTIDEKYAQKLIAEYIIKDKTINNGKPTIKGTRIAPNDIGRILCIKDNITINDIMGEYPSLEKEEEVIAGLIFYIKQLTFL